MLKIGLARRENFQIAFTIRISEHGITANSFVTPPSERQSVTARLSSFCCNKCMFEMHFSVLMVECSVFAHYAETTIAVGSPTKRKKQLQPSIHF